MSIDDSLIWKYINQHLNLIDPIDYTQLALFTHISEDELCLQFPSTCDLFTYLGDRYITTILKQHNADASYNDFMLDVLMELCDTLAPYKNTLLKVKRALYTSPCSIQVIQPACDRIAQCIMMHNTLSSWPAFVQHTVIKSLILYSLNTWLNDQSDDYIFTMARVDGTLKQLERFSKSTSGFFKT